MNLQGRFHETFSPPADAAGAAGQVTRGGREDAVPRADGILHVTDKMRAANLIFLVRPAELAPMAAGDPEIRVEIAKESRTHAFAARGTGGGVVRQARHEGRCPWSGRPMATSSVCRPARRSRPVPARFQTKPRAASSGLRSGE